MRVSQTLVSLFLLFAFGLSAQESASIIFEIDNEPVLSDEFERVYMKNRDIVVEEEDKSFEDYLDLFVEFKLKLREAYRLELDTLSSYQQELSKYREQLIQPYLQNEEAVEGLAKEAYQRTVTEVNVSHILVLVPPDASPSDSLKAYDKIIKVKQELDRGKPFDSIALKYSEDPSVVENYGSLGYFSAFAMVYPFENAAYSTAVGEIAPVLRTQFGYHLLKVNDKRPSKGQVQVAHIMVKKDSLNAEVAEEKINQIYQSLLQGDDFEKVAKEHSDDPGSAARGGLLPKFGTGRMIQSFEDASFALQEVGALSEPFQTDYGWHVVKLVGKYPVGSFESLESRLRNKVKDGSRGSYVERNLADKLSKNYEVVINMSALKQRGFLYDFEGGNDTILRIEDRAYLAQEFYAYGQSKKGKSVMQLFDDFKHAQIIAYYKEHLQETEPEFAHTFEEYRDGLLLFELLQREIWKRSEADSIGLANFFEANQNAYTWQERAELVIASCTQKEKAEKVADLMRQGLSPEQIKDRVNEGATIHVLFSQGKLEKGSSKLPEQLVFQEGVSPIFEEEKDQFTIVRIDRILPSQSKELSEARGEVINDYQQELEKQWIEELYERYPVKFNKRNIRSLKAQLE